jgi:hypothetical protein
VQRILLPSLLVGVLAGCSWQSSVSQAAAIYVATNGSDASTQPANIKAPFKTIQKATSVAKPGDTVYVRAGVYRETVRPTNSGTAQARITFRPYNNEKVIVNGTALIPSTSWKRVGNTSTYYSTWPGMYQSVNNQSDQVFVDGKMSNLARWPQEKNNDLTRPNEAIIDSVVSSTDTGKKAPGPQYSIYRVTFVDEEFDQPDGLWVGAGIWVNSGGAHDEHDGNGQTGVVIATNRETHEITVEVDAGGRVGTDKPSNFQFGKGSHYYLFDPVTVEGLLYDGQWWHDPDNKRLYVRMPDGSNPSTHRVEVKQRDWAFNLDNRSYVTVQGFNLFGTSITTDLQAGNGQGNGGNRSGSVAPSGNIIIDGINAEYVTHFTDQTGNLQTQWDQSSGVILSGSDHVIRNSTIGWSAGCGLIVIGQRNKAINNVIHDTNYTATDGGGLGLGVRPGTSALISKLPTTRFTTRLSTASSSAH